MLALPASNGESPSLALLGQGQMSHCHKSRCVFYKDVYHSWLRCLQINAKSICICNTADLSQDVGWCWSKNVKRRTCDVTARWTPVLGFVAFEISGLPLRRLTFQGPFPARQQQRRLVAVWIASFPTVASHWKNNPSAIINHCHPFLKPAVIIFSVWTNHEASIICHDS